MRFFENEFLDTKRNIRFCSPLCKQAEQYSSLDVNADGDQQLHLVKVESVGIEKKDIELFFILIMWGTSLIFHVDRIGKGCLWNPR